YHTKTCVHHTHTHQHPQTAHKLTLVSSGSSGLSLSVAFRLNQTSLGSLQTELAMAQNPLEGSFSHSQITPGMEEVCVCVCVCVHARVCERESVCLCVC